MDVVMRDIGELIPYERNQKKHDAKQVQNVANSIKRFGFVQPIVVDSKDVVVIGHCRLEAAKKLKMAEVPVLCVDDLTEDEVRELRIADNKTNESPWDFEMLGIDAAELQFEGFDFDFDMMVDTPPDNTNIERDEVDLMANRFQLIVDCESENDMQDKYERLQEAGIECRVSTL